MAEIEECREQDATFVAKDELGEAAADDEDEQAASEVGEELEEAEVNGGHHCGRRGPRC